MKNPQKWSDLSSRSYRTDKQPSIEIERNAYVLPAKILNKNKGHYAGGVCNDKFQFKAGFIRNTKEDPGFYSVSDSYKPKEEIIERDESVIFGGVLVGHFGHFILECMSRLWFITENIEKLRDYKIVFITVLDSKDWFKDFLSLFGLTSDKYEIIDKPTKFREIFIPEESVHSWKEYSDSYVKIYSFLRSMVPEGKVEKIYLTRTALKDNQSTCCNENYFEQFYKAQGFKIISPEKLSIKDQISLLSGAKEVVTTLGSLAHFALFCKKNTKFTILTRTSNDTLLAQCLVNEASSVNWTIIDVSQNLLYANRVMGVNLLGSTNYWKEYVKDTYGITLSDNTIPSNCYEYLCRWCSYYSHPIRYSRLMNLSKEQLLANLFVTTIGHIPESRNKKELSGTTIDNSHLGNVEQLLGRPFLLYKVKLSSTGWSKEVFEKQIAGSTTSNENIEEIAIRLSNSSSAIHCQLSWDRNKSSHALKIEWIKPEKFWHLRYRVYCQNQGWTKWISESKPLFFNQGGAIQVELVRSIFLSNIFDNLRSLRYKSK